MTIGSTNHKSGRLSINWPSGGLEGIRLPQKVKMVLFKAKKTLNEGEGETGADVGGAATAAWGAATAAAGATAPGPAAGEGARGYKDQKSMSRSSQPCSERMT